MGQTEEIIVEEEIEEEMVEEEEEEEVKNNQSSVNQQQPPPQARMAFLAPIPSQNSGVPSPSLSQSHVRQFSMNNSQPFEQSGSVSTGFKPNTTTLVKGMVIEDNQTEIIVEEEEEEETSTFREDAQPTLLVQPQVRQGGWVNATNANNNQ